MALTLNDEQEADLLKLLGLPEAAPGESDVELVIDTIVDLAAQVETLDPAKPSTVAAAAKRNGMEVIDTATADALRRDAAEGRRMAAAAATAKVEAAVEDAINTGRITPGGKSTGSRCAPTTTRCLNASRPSHRAPPSHCLRSATPPT